MNRIYHHYSMLEETKAGMWNIPSGQELKRLNKMALKYMQSIKKFSAGMHRVIKEWKYSCEHNLTIISSNRVAWLGQAAVCLAIGAPESCTRVSWYFLTNEQRDKANQSAEIMIQKWEKMMFPKMEQLELGF